ncbi:MAG: BamA/TamA family outer membrane protein [Bacteroidales bacterium]|nr:BamA/TamA family outer membrane protein [Bacteroidales bacterium]
MKHLFTVAVLLAAALTASAQEEITKTGLNFGPLPAIGYSSDLGWHYGVLSDIYWYGDGSTYPEYMWKANVEISRYSKGNTVLHSFFDSKYLIPGIRVSAAVSWFGNKTTNFYGFNGAASRYLPEFDKITEDGQGLYLMRRDIFRVQTCFQGAFGDSNWGWAAGLTYWNIKTGHAENKGLSGHDVSLYDIYVASGVIPEAEKNGGQHLEGKFGVVYDTRDHENNPTRGTNLEVYMFGSPDIISKHDNNYLKLAVHFKQFVPLADRLVFGAHVAFQGLVAGNAPFYMLQTIQSINMKQINTEGLGSTCTLRGTITNRLQGNSYAWMNTELRWTFAKFRWINQNWALALNPFFDMGMVVSPYRLEQMKRLDLVPNLSVDTSFSAVYGLYTGNAEKLHMSAGAGLHVIMNQNFNINFEFGKCFDPNDGTGLGMNIGLNYIF